MSNEERELLEWFRYHLRAKGTGIGRILCKAKEMGSGIARTAHDDWAEIEAKAEVCETLLASTEPEQPAGEGEEAPMEPSKSCGVQELGHSREEQCESSLFPAQQAGDCGSSTLKAKGTKSSTPARPATTPPGDQHPRTSERSLGEKPGQSAIQSTSQNSDSSPASLPQLKVVEPSTTEAEQLVERFWQEFAGEGPITDRVARRMVEWVLAQPQEEG